MRYRVLPYKQGSRSARSLADALGGKVLKLQNSTFQAYADDVIIGWGNTIHSGWQHMLNKPEYVKEVTNKLTFFNLMKADNEDIIPEFWTNKDDITDDKFPIVCRTILNGHSGAGIVVADCRDDLVECSLYTRYVKKKDEYRVHVGRTTSGSEDNYVYISIQRKARRADCPDPDWRVRNHSNGFVFVRNEVHPPESVVAAARRTLEATGLYFGAVDIGWNSQTEKATVYEVNTAPGLEGQTIEDYANYFRSL
jgi:hypothetical protein